MRQHRVGRACIYLIVYMTLTLCLYGCGSDKEVTKVILTTGFAKDEVFKIEDVKCSVPEIVVYITNIQSQYEDVYGEEIWTKSVDGTTMEDSIKNMALAKLSEIKTMVLLANRKGIVLDDSDLKKVDEATEKYYSSLNSKEIEVMGIDEELIRSMYADYALANKLYKITISEVNPEISDDEARTITVEHILFKTSETDADGKTTYMSSDDMAAVSRRANEVLLRARDGEDFEALAQEFSEDETMTLSFGKGEMDSIFEAAAFNLGKGEISNLIQTKYGFHIIKCISTFNKEITDENKIRIVEERKREAFSEEYDAFASTLVKNLNENVWSEVGLIHDSYVNSSEFFSDFDELE